MGMINIDETMRNYHPDRNLCEQHTMPFIHSADPLAETECTRAWGCALHRPRRISPRHDRSMPPRDAPIHLKWPNGEAFADDDLASL